MTDVLDAAASTPSQEIITQPTLGGVALTRDNLGSRAREISLPALTGRDSSWQLIPHAATLAGIVANTDFVPRAVRGNPAAVAALFLLGHELGLGPMSSLQGLTITPTTTGNNGKQYGGDIITYSKTLRAITRSHGHKLWPHPDEYSSERVRWSGYRADDPTHIMSVVWTMDDAKRAKLLAHDPSKPGAWEKSPRAMLSARASAELCRLIDEDGLLGISRVVEEMDDDQVIDLSSNGVAVEHPDEPDVEAPEGPPTRKRSTRPREMKTSGSATAVEAPKPEPVALAVPGDDDAPETQRTHAPAAGTTSALSPDNPSPVADLEVPGDGPKEAPASDQPRVGIEHPADGTWSPEISGDTQPPLLTAPVSAAAPVAVEQESPGEVETPTHDQVAGELNAATPAEHMPNDQKIAMLCREAGIDRAKLVSIMTDKRSESSKDLSQSQSAFVIEHVRAVIRGEEKFNAQLIPPFVVIEDAELAEVARVELSRLAGGEHLRPTLLSLGWDEPKYPRVTEWLAVCDRQKLLETISAARAAQPQPTEAT